MTTFRRIWGLLTAGQRRAAVGLLGLMLIGMVLETAGVGFVIPALKLVSDPDIAATYPRVAPWLAAAGRPSHEQIVVGGMLLLVAVAAVKAGFLAFLGWEQARFTAGSQASLSHRLFAAYLHQPWPFHLRRNSAELVRNVMIEVSMFANVLQAAMVVLTEGLAALGICLLLLFVEPAGALAVVTTMGLAAWAFHRATKTRLLHWGEARQLHDALRLQHLQQGLGGAKDIKLLGREKAFIDRFAEHNLASSRVNQRQLALQQIPRLWLELLAVVGLASLVLVMIRLDKRLDVLIPTLGLFAAAAFRIMPSANRVLGSIQTIRYSLPVVTTLHAEAPLFDHSPASGPAALHPFTTEIVLSDVSFQYDGATEPALRHATIRIPRSASVGFIGGSGAGKSTLIDLLLGLLTPSSGTVSVDGTDIQRNLRGWQAQIGYVPQSIYLTDDTLRRNVAFGLADGQIDPASLNRAIRAAQLESFVSSLPHGVETLVGERGVRLSGGQRQRIGMARALYHDPPLLVLDEATSALDTATERELMQAVNLLHGEKTLLIVAHRLSTVAACDRIFRLEDGRVVDEGETRRLLEQAARG